MDKPVNIVDNLSANWIFDFLENWGAPKEVALDKLISYTDILTKAYRSLVGLGNFNKPNNLTSS